jgi:hypothetical protein
LNAALLPNLSKYYDLTVKREQEDSAPPTRKSKLFCSIDELTDQDLIELSRSRMENLVRTEPEKLLQRLEVLLRVQEAKSKYFLSTEDSIHHNRLGSNLYL